MGRPRKNPISIKKICPICKLEYEISYRKKNQIYCSRSCKNNDPKIIDSMIRSQSNTFLLKYGSHPMKTDNTKEKFKSSILDKYGEDNPMKCKTISEKVKSSKIEKYGSANYFNIKKYKETVRKKYGVDFVTRSKEILHRIKETRKSNSYENLIESAKLNNLTPKFTIDSYFGYKWENEYEFQCDICSTSFNTTVYNHKTLFCPSCRPSGKNLIENEIYEFLLTKLKGTDIKVKDRTVLYGKELDFYIEKLKIAIELNGLYWHSDIEGGKVKNYHLNKTKMCACHGIRLLHIFEDEWKSKSDIVKSIISNVLNFEDEKYMARKCEIKEINNSEKKLFLEKNHIQGDDRSSIRYGLFFNGEMVSCMTFGKSRYDKKTDYELLRFCNKLNSKVHGAAGKLFSHFLKTHKPKTIVSYSDRRFFTGDVYSKLGFNFVDMTPPSYYYVSSDYKIRLNRQSFQKHTLLKKLQKFDENLTEWENMKENKFDRIWDCGNSKWIYKSE